MPYNHFYLIRFLIENLLKIGVNDVILCPGSRSAPLAISILESKKFRTHTILDERSAGYIAIGISRESGRPVAIICTSGTAVNNLTPSCSEAFFSETPIIYLTGDRPENWIGKQDNQAIFQQGIFGKNIAASIPLNSDKVLLEEQFKLETDKIRTGLEICYKEKLPIHFNFPFEEPFYPNVEDLKLIRKNDSIFEIEEYSIPNSDLSILKSFEGKKILYASSFQHEKVTNTDSEPEDNNIIHITDILNINATDNSPNLNILGKKIEEIIQPEILITSGNGFVNKSFKDFIRNSNIQKHIHISRSGNPVDTFQKNCIGIKGTSSDIWKELSEIKGNKDFYTNASKHSDLLPTLFINFKKENPELIYSETNIILNLSAVIGINLIHLGNSTVVRHLAQFPTGIYYKKFTGNRGTSGIDGSISTAIGHCMASPDKLQLLILGDQSFQYDCGALFYAHQINNLGIVIINNGGGKIFSLLKGPKESPYLDQYFTNKHSNRFEHIALQHHFEYLLVEGEEAILNLFKELENKKSADYLKNKMIEIIIPEQGANLNQYSEKWTNHLESYLNSYLKNEN